MPQPRVSGRSIPSPFDARLDVRGRALPMGLPRLERRDLVRRAAIERRIAAEFRDMPGLILTVAQASRLLGVDVRACERILASLERDGLLRRNTSGTYARA
jgi:hypothetical protein